MPDSVKCIGRYAFANMEKLSSVRLSKSLKKFGFKGKVVVKKKMKKYK